MLVPNGLFDVVLFGALLVAAVLDGMFPALHGAASLLAVGTATYIAAQELSTLLDRRGWWTQESLVTSLALCAAGFIYYWWRNQSDFALLALSVGLMMASLMTTIAVISGVGVAMRDSNANSIVSLGLLVIGGIGLGVLAGLLALALGRTGSDASLIGKIIVVGLAYVVWKLRENMRPPVPNTSANAVMANDISQLSQPTTRNLYGQPIEAPGAGVSSHVDEPTSALEDSIESPMRAPAAMPMGAAHAAIVPQRGTLLDRFLPALVLGALLFVLSQQGGRWLAEPFAPSVAADNRGTTRQPPAPSALR